ncbi:pyridoxamine 5'-phosphate oxidase [Christiangramia sp. OXR-203]|jgi:pyridoxamine 5'-phosphate oxidase|uniref:pyridoxamine 5'-phosphate oxidase n=1 Tax=Christiangramia sp. OXR-203 TaxID=3100176 RepID=UPI002AC910C6|nr:pyridoxamine 5'-phosphate oxidase [Christiangramia sp. OXR-203]WPY99952.1 pyridoxamine 5'-phosphate oxidase [Christiangramia sp. OXR-203]
MNKNLNDYRKSYKKDRIEDDAIPQDPLQFFQDWFNQADNSDDILEANAMNIATVGKDMVPKSRIILLKAFGLVGFHFYTNYSSDKGKALAENPNCCLSFFWPELEKQVIIQGTAVKISEEESEAYFHSRPKGSQLGAMASDQSSVIPSREYLEEKLSSLEEKYDSKEIPKPKDWGGYVFQPEIFEFWQGRESRLHDRIRYKKITNSWNYERLAP